MLAASNSYTKIRCIHGLFLICLFSLLYPGTLSDAFSPTLHQETQSLRSHACISSVPRLDSRPLRAVASLDDYYNLVVVGDLHMEDDMSSHERARTDCLQALQQLSIQMLQEDKSVETTDSNENTLLSLIETWQSRPAGELSVAQLQMLCQYQQNKNSVVHSDHGGSDANAIMHKYNHLVSLGDLGRKDIRHEPGDAGTTLSFQMAKQYFDGFFDGSDATSAVSSLNLVTGNHDLEGLDEFTTDHDNLQAWMKTFGKDSPQFQQYVGDKTLLLGLSTVRFRDAPHSSHEVHIDDEQIDWFIKTVRDHPYSEGWKIFVFSHAPIIGSGLRVLQNVHVTNGCAWLNHVSDNRNIFIDTVKANPQIKCWFSGHFHLSHDYQDAIVMVEHDPSSVPTNGDSIAGSLNNNSVCKTSCAFVQVGVMGPVSTRDSRRQTRIVQGDSRSMRMYTVQHHLSGSDVADTPVLRLDLTVDFETGEYEFTNSEQEVNRDDWFQAYTPKDEDGCYLEHPDGSVANANDIGSKVCWWRMNDGRVLGLHQRQLVEYDARTLAPLGIVVNEKQLNNRDVVLVENGTVLVLIDNDSTDEDNKIEVVHPNSDGSYWRKFQRNKKVRQEEKAREAIAKMWVKQNN